MVGEIRGGKAPGQRVGYMALHCTDDGTWTPVDGRVQESAEQADKQCHRSLKDQLALLHDSIGEEMQTLRENLDRIGDTPRPDDCVQINGRACHIEDDGSFAILAPVSRAFAPHEHLRDLVSDSVYQTLSVVLNLSGEREQHCGLIIDQVLEDMADVLDRTESLAPGEFDNICQFAVNLYRSARKHEISLLSADDKRSPTELSATGPSVDDDGFLITRHHLRAGRAISGIAVRDLAERARLSPTAISQIETGKTQTPREKTLMSLASVLSGAGVEFAGGGWVRHRDDADCDAANHR